MNSPRVTKDATPGRLNSTACNECKQQKLKCDFNNGPDEKCRRCTRNGLECTIKDGFRRVNKRMYALHGDPFISPIHLNACLHRNTKALYKQNEQLRQQLEAAAAGDTSRATEANPEMLRTEFMATDTAGRQYIPPTPILADQISGGSLAPAAAADQAYRPHRSGPTLAREIAGVRILPSEIDEIFSIYFPHYHKHLPFLDPRVSPNGFYEQSHLLFWAIVGVGARRYTGNPTLLGSIMDPILHLGWPPLHATPAIVPAIQALLVLSFFPFPTDTTSKDNSYTLSGMAITLAMQIGLHAPTHDQDYYSSFQINSEDIARRVRLWHYCVVIHQKAACGLGYPITVSPDRLEKQMDLEGLLSLVPAGLLLEMKLGMLLSRINSLFAPSPSSGQEEHFRFTRSMMADNFEAQLDELESDRAPSDLERLYLNIARLQLRVHCLRDCGNEKENLSIVQLGLSATFVVDLTEKLDFETGLATHCPHYVYRMITLASAVLLRFLKVQMHDDRRESTQAYRARYFKAISLLKRMSVINNDMPSRMAHIFSQLWSSDRVFRQANGLTFPIRTQSRLSMSILHDTMWEWREEFGGRRRVDQKRPPGLVQYQAGNGSGDLHAHSPYAANPEGVLTDPPSNGSSGMFWDSAFDQDFESMIKEFPEAWPQ